MGDSPWWVLPTQLKKSDLVLKIGPSHKGKVGFPNSPTFDMGARYNLGWKSTLQNPQPTRSAVLHTKSRTNGKFNLKISLPHLLLPSPSSLPLHSFHLITFFHSGYLWPWERVRKSRQMGWLSLQRYFIFNFYFILFLFPSPPLTISPFSLLIWERRGWYFELEDGGYIKSILQFICGGLGRFWDPRAPF